MYRLRKSKNVKIFTNIKFNKNVIPNATYITDDQIVDTMDDIIVSNLNDRKKYCLREETD